MCCVEELITVALYARHSQVSGSTGIPLVLAAATVSILIQFLAAASQVVYVSVRLCTFDSFPDQGCVSG